MYLFIIIIVVVAIVEGCILSKLYSKYNIAGKTIEELVKTNDNKEEFIRYKEKQITDLQMSLKNADIAHQFINTLKMKSTYCHQRYLKIYKKELQYDKSSQVVYAIFYEDDYIYEMNFLESKNENFDVCRDVSRFKLECRMFIDGEQLDPSLNSHITRENDSVNIEELNLYKHEGKGAGSFYLECLSKELMHYPQIECVTGCLSTVDVGKKNKLIHFYKKNGFEEIMPMTEKSFGHIKKTIRIVEDNTLKLNHKDMTFGIEIEFQLRNQHRPETLAKRMYEQGLSSCNEVRRYNTVADIQGWKIIKEKTCDYEIISPILNDSEKCWKEINSICFMLYQFGAYTDDDCAFHVHIGTKDLICEGKQWIMLRNIYKQLEPVTHVLAKGEFDNVSHRRLECYAITIAMADTLWCKGWSIAECEKHIKSGDVSLVSHFYRTRRVGMNWNCMSEDGKTIEFRIFNGTIDFSQIQLYLMYICNLVDKVASNEVIELPIEDILHEKQLTEDYINEAINYLSSDNLIRNKLIHSIQNKTILDSYTWNMLEGSGTVHIEDY